MAEPAETVKVEQESSGGGGINPWGVFLGLVGVFLLLGAIRGIKLPSWLGLAALASLPALAGGGGQGSSGGGGEAGGSGSGPAESSPPEGTPAPAELPPGVELPPGAPAPVELPVPLELAATYRQPASVPSGWAGYTPAPGTAVTLA